ncbi:MAG: peptide-methionine (S)-S-oxide reductase MsrA [Bryobacteraceae bacterium]
MLKLMARLLLRFVIPAMAVIAQAAVLPAPAYDIPAPAAKQTATAVFAGGCFWGVEAVFERLKGVTGVVSGFVGGSKASAHYQIVSTGLTKHAESVKIAYDPALISFGQLLEVFFSVAHDPTELNRQGPDEGPQYRSAIFYTSDEQKRVAEAYIEQLTNQKIFRHRIVTQVVPFTGFYAAEAYHQRFFDRNPDNPYIVYNDVPKVKRLRKEFPELLKAR